MIRQLLYALAISGAMSLVPFSQQPVLAQQPTEPWRFVVSGDSRNCGNVVMPAIAASATAAQSDFYWHLGDLRFILNFDEDMQHDTQRPGPDPMTVISYLSGAWPDFKENQIGPFGTMPFYLGIGNHETVFDPMFGGARAAFVREFSEWLDTPVLRQQRLKDDPDDTEVKTYYRWVQRGVSFFYLDNATSDMFDDRQMEWFNRLVEADVADPAITTIVVGMHSALPDSISFDHSMSQFPAGVTSGRQVYTKLLDAQAAGKKVYVVASHLHAFIDGVFNTPYWRENGGVLPGWVVGTAGAHRVNLPPEAEDANAALANVYGSLLATVQPDGTIQFDFQQVNEADVPAAVVERYTSEFVHYCFAENSEATD